MEHGWTGLSLSLAMQRKSRSGMVETVFRGGVEIHEAPCGPFPICSELGLE